MAKKFKFNKAPKKRSSKDKQTFIIGFIIAVLVLWSVITYLDTRTTTPSPAPFGFEDNAVCGNGFVEPGENCGTCYLDARCLSTETCSSGVCLQKRASLLPFTIPLIFLSLIGIFLLSYRLMHRKKEVDPRHVGRGSTKGGWTKISRIVKYNTNNIYLSITKNT